MSKYGVIVQDNKAVLVSGLIEKPNFENAPSNFTNIGDMYSYLIFLIY